MEVVKRTRITIARLPGEPIGHGEVEGRLVLFDGFRTALVAHVRILTYAEPQAPEGGRIMAGEYGLEPISKGKTVDPRGWREQRCTQLAPESGFFAIALEHQAGHSEERLPEKTPANTAGDLVIDGWVRVLPAHFPEKAARVGIKERFPVVEACRSRESLVHGSLIWMSELVHGEAVRINPPRLMDEVVPEA